MKGGDLGRDHFQLPVYVVAEGHRSALVKPWATIFEDDKTRMPMSWALTARLGAAPDADVVCATLAKGIRLRVEREHEVGGVPNIVRTDQGADFLAGMVGIAPL